jgi:hypothetical protein
MFLRNLIFIWIALSAVFGGTRAFAQLNYGSYNDQPQRSPEEDRNAAAARYFRGGDTRRPSGAAWPPSPSRGGEASPPSSSTWPPPYYPPKKRSSKKRSPSVLESAANDAADEVVTLPVFSPPVKVAPRPPPPKRVAEVKPPPEKPVLPIVAIDPPLTPPRLKFVRTVLTESERLAEQTRMLKALDSLAKAWDDTKVSLEHVGKEEQVFKTVVPDEEIEERRFCQQRYQSLSKQEKVKIDLFLGYEEYKEQAFDTVERAAWSKWLQQPCVGRNLFCGFASTSSDSDMDTLTKSIPWGDEKKEVEMRIFDSSIGTIDKQNRSNPDQEIKSQNVMIEFLKAIENPETSVVLYKGTSRTRGNFKPSKMGTGDPLLTKQVEGALSGRDEKLFALGFLSNNDRDHWNVLSTTEKIDNLIVANRWVDSYSALDAIVYTLERILARGCGPAMTGQISFISLTPSSVDLDIPSGPE